MRISQRGIELIIQFEGFESKPYKCPAGVWTIGYGHTKGVGPLDCPLTHDEACALLEQDLVTYADEVEQFLKVPVTQNQFDALVSFHYNTGALGTSTLLKKLNSGFVDSAANEFLRWTKAKGKVLAGLVRRRAAEMELFRGLQ